MKTFPAKIALFFILAVFAAVPVSARPGAKKASASASVTAKKSTKAAVVAAEKSAPAMETGEDADSPVPVPVPPSEDTAVPQVKGLDAQMVNALAPAPQSVSQDPSVPPSAPVPTEGAFPPKSGYIGAQESKTPEPSQPAEGGLTEKLIRLGGTSGRTQAVDPLERVALPTLAVIAAIAVLALLWKFMASRGGGLFASQDKLRILGQQMIGPRSKIIIVEALGKKYLVGATHERVSLIADLDLFGTADDESAPVFSPRSELKRSETAPMASGASQEPDVAVSAEETAEKIKERLKSLKKISK
jgi:flagellar biogenesis protein FliO